MNHDAREKTQLDWHVATRPIGGQTVSGDLHLVKPFARGVLLPVASLRTAGGRRARQVSWQLTDAHYLLLETIDSVHGFARELRPAMLDELGLLPALRSYQHGLSQRSGLRVQSRGNALTESLGAARKPSSSG
jgi:hypothetical protein